MRFGARGTGELDRAEQLLRDEIPRSKPSKRKAQEDPWSVSEGWRDVFKFLLRHDRWDDASALVEAHLDDFPKISHWAAAIWRWQRAFLLLATGRYQELERVIRWCQGGRVASADHFVALHYRAARLLELGLLEEAAAELKGLQPRAAQALTGPHTTSTIREIHRCQLDQARLLLMQGRPDAARAVYAAMRSDEKIDKTGAVLLGVGRYAAALKRARAFDGGEGESEDEVELRYWGYDALVVTGCAQIELGRAKAAISALTAAAAKIPSGPVAWYHLARARALAKAPSEQIIAALARASSRGFGLLAARDPLLANI